MMYIRSTMTGQVYKVDSFPKFPIGWEVVSEQEYIDYCQKRGF